MTIAKQNPTQQRQQPLSLSNALSSLSARDLDLPSVRSMPNSRRDRKEQRAFLRSVIDQAIGIAATGIRISSLVTSTPGRRTTLLTTSKDSRLLSYRILYWYVAAGRDETLSRWMDGFNIIHLSIDQFGDAIVSFFIFIEVDYSSKQLFCTRT
jgi:hypothetical protein